MSLASQLRAALEAGGERGPLLIPGDDRDPEREPASATPAAVLVPIVERPDPTMVLTLRLDTLRQHGGQIAFPGGRIDPSDEGPVEAALREAEEEIDLSRDRVEVIGIADRYHTITGFEVTPVVGVVPPDLDLTPHPGEVAAIFEVPVRHLLDPANQLVRTIMWHGSRRTYYEIFWEDRRIWGATAAMIVNLSRRLALSL